MAKNYFLKTLILGAVVWAGAGCHADPIADTKNRIKATSQTNVKNPDQPFCFFKTTGKHPVLITGLPGRNEKQTVDFGTVKPNGKIRYVEQLQDFDKLIPIHAVWHFGDPNLYKEEKYMGWSDKTLEMAAEYLLRIFYLLNTKPTEKNSFVEAYNKDYPTKMVFKKSGHFKAFRKYLLKRFEKNNVVAPEQKPLLLIAFEDGAKDLDQDDYEFLNTYYEVVDPEDKNIQALFVGAQNYLTDMTSMHRGKAIQVGKTFGQILLGLLKDKKEIGGLSWEKLLGMILLGWSAKAIFDSFNSKKSTWFNQRIGTKDVKDEYGRRILGGDGSQLTKDVFGPNKKVILGVMGGLFGSFLACRIVKALFDKDKVVQELLEEYKQENDELVKDVEKSDLEKETA